VGEKYKAEERCISQLHMAIAKCLRQLTCREKRLILASGSGGSSPKLGSSFALSLW
jgi:hypothetical protein